MTSPARSRLSSAPLARPSGVPSPGSAGGFNARHKLRQAQRRARALELRAQGCHLDAIGRELGISASAASRLVRRALHRHEAELVEDVRKIERIRLERCVKALMPKAMKGDCRAIESLLRVMDRRAKLDGLDLGKGDANVNVNVGGGLALPTEPGDLAKIHRALAERYESSASISTTRAKP